jgi:Uncharacterised protein family (UPF0149)
MLKCNEYSPAVNLQPLTDAELDKLADVLKRFGDKRAMNLEMLDGFFAALICGPDDVPPSEYLREIWGGDMVNEFPAKRYSITKFRPSGDSRFKYPTTGIAACCAHAASGHAAAPPRSVMSSRRFS